MKAVWLAIWPSLSKTLSESLIKKPVTEGAEVNACKDESVSKEGGPSLVVVAPEQEIEVNFVISESEENESEEKENSDAEVKVEEDAAARAKAIDEAFQKEFSAVEELVLTEGVKAAAG